MTAKPVTLAPAPTPQRVCYYFNSHIIWFILVLIAPRPFNAAVEPDDVSCAWCLRGGKMLGMTEQAIDAASVENLGARYACLLEASPNLYTSVMAVRDHHTPGSPPALRLSQCHHTENVFLH